MRHHRTIFLTASLVWALGCNVNPSQLASEDSPELDAMFDRIMAANETLDDSKFANLKLEDMAKLAASESGDMPISLGGVTLPALASLATGHSRIFKTASKQMPTVADALHKAGLTAADLRITSKAQLRDGLAALRNAFDVLANRQKAALALGADPYEPDASANIDPSTVTATKKLARGDMLTPEGKAIASQPYCDPNNTNADVRKCESDIQGRANELKRPNGPGPGLGFQNCERAAINIAKPGVARVDTTGRVQGTNMTPKNLSDYYMGVCSAAYWAVTNPA